MGWVRHPSHEIASPRGTDRGRDGLDSDVGTGVGRVDHLAVADVDADVGHVGGALAEEDEVAGLEGVAGSELGGGVVLVLGDAGQADAGDLVGGLDESAAVEADAGRLAAPYIWSADLGECPVDGDPSGGARRDGLGLRLVVGLGEVEDLGDVALAVVVVAMPTSA